VDAGALDAALGSPARDRAQRVIRATAG
jgi:hypothetical protein